MNCTHLQFILKSQSAYAPAKQHNFVWTLTLTVDAINVIYTNSEVEKSGFKPVASIIQPPFPLMGSGVGTAGSPQ